MSGSEGLEHDSVGREGMVAALSGEDEDVVRYVYIHHVCIQVCMCIQHYNNNKYTCTVCVCVCVHPL